MSSKKNAEHRIYAAIGAMPFGALVRGPRWSADKRISLTQVADYLEELKCVLETHVHDEERERERRDRFQQLENEVEHAGRLFKRLLLSKDT